MDYMEKITELRASKAKLIEQAQALVTEGKFEDANNLADQMEGINTQLQAVERLLDESGKLCLNKAKLIVYSHGDYLALGRKLGSFGYSVRKKKKIVKK